jgi:hypothetical protein
VRMKPWDAVELMETFVDVSDPDVELPQIVHMLQTAESIRNAGLPGVFVQYVNVCKKMSLLCGCLCHFLLLLYHLYIYSI